MPEWSKDSYALSREASESRRLDEQHELYKQCFGYLLHPEIRQRLPTHPRIADVGTGTAIVLRELASDLPDAQLDGFDISADQFPAEIPARIELHIANCKEPFPPEFIGRFDVIFLRCMVTVLEPPHEWEKVAYNVLALLKPGGAIQWMESQFSTQRLIYGELNSTSRGIKTLLQAAHGVIGRHKLAWDNRNLVDIFRDLGMVGVAKEMTTSDRVVTKRSVGVRLRIEVGYGALKKRGMMEPDKLEELVAEARRDVESGTHASWEIYCYWGFKAEESKVG
ncbi:S-adenosyl-L-methionine-dependent methyltransferase [Xylariales sp. PMI_506]|nr:S-adenosyl-L-methionine-dependent methyltransferase [Xylariales sp. PMI_506]